jgi:hypothetical protein
MPDKKPAAISEYKIWLNKEHKCQLDRIERYYHSVTSKIKTDLEKRPFWTGLCHQLKEFDDQYFVMTGFQLQMGAVSPEIQVKPFDSYLLKTFRKNVINNKKWPEQPDGGWLIPNSCLSRINDIVRTLVVVKYLDGVQFLVDKLKSFCDQGHADYKVHFEAREDGYYAGHTYIKQTFEIPRMTWDTENIEMSIEVQITTQLQEAIRKLLHIYYEDRRIRITRETERWQWNYKSDEFGANYLGHILHYVEGMIVEIREKQKRGIS